MTERIEQPNLERIRMPGEKETHKYLEILETNTNKEEEMKKKASVSDKRENFWKQSSAAGIL